MNQQQPPNRQANNVREIEAISQPIATFADIVYICQKPDHVRLVFSEIMPELQETKARTAIVMTLQSYLNFVRSLTEHAYTLQSELAKAGVSLPGPMENMIDPDKLAQGTPQDVENMRKQFADNVNKRRDEDRLKYGNE